MQAYNEAMGAGNWAQTYAAENQNEYWAEGVQSYFNTNIEADPPDGVHNSVNTREELEAYDAKLYALVDKVFQGISWQPSCPPIRAPQGLRPGP